MALNKDHWTGRHFIDGAWLAGVELFDDRNPARRSELIGRFPRGTAAEVDAAVTAARRAFDPWRRTSRIQRGELFLRLANLIQEQIDPLAMLLRARAARF